jgi:glycosyltransferase involved in cell wall biosynthesis
MDSGVRAEVRVLTVVGSLMLGGAETYVSRVVRTIRSYGVDMEICALERTGPLLAQLEEDGVLVHDTPFPSPNYRSTISRLLATVDAIRRVVKAGRFDIVHTYLFWADVLGVTGARLAGCRRIVISRRALHGWTHGPKARYHAMEQASNLLANELIANSTAVLRDAEAHERILPSVRTVIYSGVDVNQYEPARSRADGPVRLVTVGALAPRKGQEYAVEAIAILARSGVKATLELVGTGPDEAMLRRKVADAGLRGLVTFAGQQEDPRPYLKHADVFLLPSRQEGFPVALLEAMASALPAIATDVGGNAEALIDGKGGRVVPPQQPKAIAAAIAEMAVDRPRLPEMGRFNRQRVTEKFSIEASARRLADWYIHGPLPRTGNRRSASAT